MADSNPIVEAAEKRATYETLLTSSLVQMLAQVPEGRPWAAVALAYHHGLSFAPMFGVLPESEYEELSRLDSSPQEIFNPAEWSLYDDDPLFTDGALDALAVELCAIAEASDLSGTPRFGREIHVRVMTALRPILVEKGWLSASGLVYATDYEMVDFADNVAAANPSSALTERAGALLSP